MGPAAPGPGIEHQAKEVLVTYCQSGLNDILQYSDLNPGIWLLVGSSYWRIALGSQPEMQHLSIIAVHALGWKDGF